MRKPPYFDFIIVIHVYQTYTIIITFIPYTDAPYQTDPKGVLVCEGNHYG